MAPDRRAADNLAGILGRIADAASRSGRRTEDITLVAVTKGRNLADVEALWDAGQRIFAESRVQEALPKMAAFQREAEWHLIGHLQTNKAKAAAGAFGLIHGCDSARILETLDREGGKAGRKVRCLIQVNIAGEERKSGCAPDEAQRLLDLAEGLKNIRIEGLMTIAPLEGGSDAARRTFLGLRELRGRLAESGAPAGRLHTLSMGMSADFEIAVEEGSTLVRVGSALFEGVE